MIVSPVELERVLDSVVVVEVGSDRRAFRRGHVRRARFLDWSSIARETSRGVELPDRGDLQLAIRSLGVGNEAPIVIYSRDILQATWAWFVFDSLGHGDRVAVLDGGWSGWLREGRPVAGGDFVPKSKEFTARAGREAMIGIEELRVALGGAIADRPFVIDARATEEFRGDGPGRSAFRAGHIPGAFSISWLRNIEVVDGVAVFRTAGGLRELYLPMQAAYGRQAVAYCGTGLEASMSYFVLRSLGLDARLYTGSFVEWSMTPDVPVARTARDGGPGGR
jgi:thiosulfate/3-mercaptopyruvate sulfurtransferase